LITIFLGLATVGVKSPNPVEKTNFLKTYEKVRLTLGKHMVSSEKYVSGKFGLSSQKSGKFVLSSHAA
jgi:hypothetical protein